LRRYRKYISANYIEVAADKRNYFSSLNLAEKELWKASTFSATQISKSTQMYSKYAQEALFFYKLLMYNYLYFWHDLYPDRLKVCGTG
jgi:hypothetical protein